MIRARTADGIGPGLLQGKLDGWLFMPAARTGTRMEPGPHHSSGAMLVSGARGLESSCRRNRYNARDFHVWLRQTPRTWIGPERNRDTKRRINLQRNDNEQFDFLHFTARCERRIPRDSDQPGSVCGIWSRIRRPTACRSAGELNCDPGVRHPDRPASRY